METTQCFYSEFKKREFGVDQFLNTLKQKNPSIIKSFDIKEKNKVKVQYFKIDRWEQIKAIVDAEMIYQISVHFKNERKEVVDEFLK